MSFDSLVLTLQEQVESLLLVLLQFMLLINFISLTKSVLTFLPHICKATFHLQTSISKYEKNLAFYHMVLQSSLVYLLSSSYKIFKTLSSSFILLRQIHSNVPLKFNSTLVQIHLYLSQILFQAVIQVSESHFNRLQVVK